MEKADIINALDLLGAYLDQHASGMTSSSSALSKLNDLHFESFEQLIKNEHIYNPWFTEEFIRKALSAIAQSLKKDQIEYWLDQYKYLPVQAGRGKTIGVIMAGNIPLVGFHDFLTVIISGHRILGKLSVKDERLMKKVAEIICDIYPGFVSQINFTEGYLKNIDAVITTGSNNSSRYFEYYFRTIPHIIRKNRSSVAILSGNESSEDLLKLGEDIFSYFGLGCRNVTKLFVPQDYNIVKLLFELESFTGMSSHNKYGNNLDYNRSVYLMNKIPFLDNGVILIKEDMQLSSPVGVVNFEKYSQIDDVIENLNLISDNIQCVVTKIEGINKSVAPGESQKPKLWDYADGIDTMKFLSDLYN